MMPLRKAGALALVVSQLGCAALSPERPPPSLPSAPPMQVSILPPEVDVQGLVPPVEDLPPAPANAPKFDTLAINGGRYCEPTKDGKERCEQFQAGYVVSEETYGKAIIARDDARRLFAEQSAMRKLRTAERAAILEGERAYQSRILGLERQNEELRKPDPLAGARFYIGMFSGIAISMGSFYAATRIVKW